MKILVSYDGTLQAKRGLRYGLQKAGEQGGEVILLQVFDPGLFVDYEAGPQAEAMARAEAASHLEDARGIVREYAGTPVRVLSEEGDAGHLILKQAEEEGVDQIITQPRFKDIIKSTSTPVHVIPGTILAPVDSTNSAFLTLDMIRQEAGATDSKVVVVGIVPVHLYSREEKKELARVQKDTTASVKALCKALSALGIETRDLLRSGYPDEEILKAADEFSASLIILPSGGATPSELSKAAAIFSDEPERVKRPVLLAPVSA